MRAELRSLLKMLKDLLSEPLLLDSLMSDRLRLFALAYSNPYLVLVGRFELLVVDPSMPDPIEMPFVS